MRVSTSIFMGKNHDNTNSLTSAAAERNQWWPLKQILLSGFSKLGIKDIITSRQVTWVTLPTTTLHCLCRKVFRCSFPAEKWVCRAYEKSVSTISVFLPTEQENRKTGGMNFVSQNNEYFCSSVWLGGYFPCTATCRTKISRLLSTFGITESKLNITTHYMVTSH